MNGLYLYENVPINVSPIRLVEFHSLPDDFLLHHHEQTELLYLKEGDMTVRCGEKIIKASEGDCIIINGNELHEGISGNCNFICLYLPPAFFEDQYYTFTTKIQDKFIVEILLKILEKQSEKKHADMLAIKGYAYLLISHLINNYTENTFTEARYRQHLEKSAKINDAIKYIENNCFNDISIKYLAQISHMSQSSFCHIFKNVMGKSAKEYILTKRIEKAIDMIKSTNMTIIEIAMQCGFSDANYFSRVFKKYKKCTPSYYRK